jgi:hypothetical protein
MDRGLNKQGAKGIMWRKAVKWFKSHYAVLTARTLEDMKSREHMRVRLSRSRVVARATDTDPSSEC